MAPPAGTLRVGRYFLALLAILVLLGAIVAFGSRHTPKLGIDLVGGTEVRFTAVATNGEPPSASSMEQARQIIADRVNGTGVTQATVVVQGNDQLVVSVPGQDASGDIEKLGAAAKLNFRGVIAPPVPVSCTSATTGSSGSATPSGSGTATSSAPSSSTGTSPATSTSPSTTPSTSSAPAQANPVSSGGQQSGAAASERPLAQASTPATKSATKSTPSGTKSAATSASKTASGSTTASPTGTGSATGSATPSGSATTTAPPAKCSSDPLKIAAKAGKFTIPTTDTEFEKLSSTNQQFVQAALANYDCTNAGGAPDPTNGDYIACADGASYGAASKYIAFLLGPVIVPGTQIDSADSVAPNGTTTQYTVSLSLKDSGSAAWAKYTAAHNIGGSGSGTTSVISCGASTFPCADFVAFTLDGLVVSAPVNESAINGLPTQISGSFTQQSANDLANKLKFGALPLSFKPDQAQTVSATLGTQQLEAALIAGGIGLLLVVIYSLLYYRALGLVTIASLLVSGAITYGALVMLATQISFTLSLAGIAGFIVAVGITADSFVVFFERLKDEVHEGRSVRVAVPRAWVRSRRTILSADTVSFLAAAVLYYFTTDEVRGFAFTLGLSTIIDLIVVFLFTHPLVSLLSRSKAFGSARFTGLDSVREHANEAEGTTRPARPARKTAAKPADPAKAARTATATVTLDKTDTAFDETAELDDPVVDTDDVETAEFDEADSTEADDDPGLPRRRTAPETGTAAERAAARRARLRAQRESGDDQKGNS